MPFDAYALELDRLNAFNTRMISAKEKNQATLNRFFQAMASNDTDAMESCFATDACWHFPQSFHGRPHQEPRSATAIVALLTGATDAFYDPATIRSTPQFVVVDEHCAAYQFRMACTAANGKPYDNQYVFSFRFEDGLIVEGWEHLDSLYFEQVVNQN